MGKIEQQCSRSGLTYRRDRSLKRTAVAEECAGPRVEISPDRKGDSPPELELATLGVSSRLAKERGLLIGKPFEVADAKALLRLLEFALPGVLNKLAQRT